MSDLSQRASSADVDLLDAIETAITQYPPLVNDRRHVKVAVQDGLVTIEGHVRTSITCRYVHDKFGELAGVKGVDISGLYDDETIRLEVGQIIPFGVWANVEYGHVILTGRVSSESDSSALISQVKLLPGVRDVRTKFIA